MFNKIRYAYYMTKIEKLIKKGVSIDDERVKHNQKKIRNILWKKVRD